MHQDKREMHTQNKRKQTNKQGKKEKKKQNKTKLLPLLTAFFSQGYYNKVIAEKIIQYMYFFFSFLPDFQFLVETFIVAFASCVLKSSF